MSPLFFSLELEIRFPSGTRKALTVPPLPTALAKILHSVLISVAAANPLNILKLNYGEAAPSPLPTENVSM